MLWRDAKLALHILNVHMNKDNETAMIPEIEPELFTKYIEYCKKNCHPVLSQSAAELLSAQYVNFRREARKRNVSIYIPAL